MPVTPRTEAGDRWIPAAHQPDNLDKTVSFQISGRAALKGKSEKP